MLDRKAISPDVPLFATTVTFRIIPRDRVQRNAVIIHLKSLFVVIVGTVLQPIQSPVVTPFCRIIRIK